MIFTATARKINNSIIFSIPNEIAKKIPLAPGQKLSVIRIKQNLYQIVHHEDSKGYQAKVLKCGKYNNKIRYKMRIIGININDGDILCMAIINNKWYLRVLGPKTTIRIRKIEYIKNHYIRISLPSSFFDKNIKYLIIEKKNNNIIIYPIKDFKNIFY